MRCGFLCLELIDNVLDEVVAEPVRSAGAVIGSKGNVPSLKSPTGNAWGLWLNQVLLSPTDRNRVALGPSTTRCYLRIVRSCTEPADTILMGDGE